MDTPTKAATDPVAALAEALHHIGLGCAGIVHIDDAAAILAVLAVLDGWTLVPTDLDGRPFCPGGYAQRYHAIRECDCYNATNAEIARLRAALESAVRLLAAIPVSVDVEQAGMQAELATMTLRAALAEGDGR